MKIKKPTELLPPPNGSGKVIIVTGPINSGKTTFLSEWYKTWRLGDGFLSVKVFEGMEHTGYDLEWVAGGEKRPWIRADGHETQNWETLFSIGRYKMSREGFEFAEKIIGTMLERHIEPVVFDEIGLLELEGKCFAGLLRRILDKRLCLVAAARDFIIPQLLQNFPELAPEIVQIT